MRIKVYTESQLKAIKELVKYRGQPLVIRYRESNTRCLIYAGGGLISRKNKPPVWNEKGIEITELIAKAINTTSTDEGIRCTEFYTNFISSMGDNLIKTLNAIVHDACGISLFNLTCVAHVNARGTML